jgi:hypothetical protein
MEPRRLRTAVVDGDADEDVFRCGLRVLEEHVEVAVLVEDAGIDQLVLEFLAGTAPILLHQLAIWISRLRILVQPLHIGVGRRAVDVEVVLLRVLAVIPFAVGQAEQPLLENRIALVPQREGEAQLLLVVANPAETVFAPAVGARSRLIVAEIRPGVAVVTVVLTDGAPLTLAEIRPPLLPGHAGLARIVQTLLFGAIGSVAFHGSLQSGPCVRVDTDPGARLNR